MEFQNFYVKGLWVIAVTWYMEHPCKVCPSQVWSCVQRSEIDLIPITSFISRAVALGEYLEACQ